MTDEHDLTDHHGEAEALRRENVRLRAHIQAMQGYVQEYLEPGPYVAKHGRAETFNEPHMHQHEDYAFYMRAKMREAVLNDLIHMLDGPEERAALAASRAPDPVANADSCQPGGLISREAVQRWITDSISAVMGCIDLRAEEEAAAILWLRNFDQAIRALPAAPVAEALPVAWGQTGVMDRHGRMICVGDRIRIDLTSPATNREYWQPEYIIEWKPPAFKLRYVGGDKDSDTARWKFSTVQPSSTAALEIISQRPPAQPTIGGAELDALVARLEPALRLLPITTHDTQDYAEATGPNFQAMTMDRAAFEALNALSDAITALRAQPDWREQYDAAMQAMVQAQNMIDGWKSMAERLGNVLGEALRLQPLDDSCDVWAPHALSTLSDLAKMKGGTK